MLTFWSATLGEWVRRLPGLHRGLQWLRRASN